VARAIVLALLALSGVLADARDAAAEDARVHAAREAYIAQQLERTIELVDGVLTMTTLDEHDRASALRLAGCAYMVLGDRTTAVAKFRESFGLEPDASLERHLASSPDARSLFEIARGEWRAALVSEMEDHAADIAKVQIEPRVPNAARGGTPVDLDFRIEDPARLVSRVELSYRRRGQDAFTRASERFTGQVTPLRFTIPSDLTESADPFLFDYYVTLRHHSGFDLKRYGDADHPHAIAISAGQRKRWHESWLVRGAIAAGLASLGAGGYFIYRSIDVGPQHVVIR
jgi:hypothetical protein